MPTRVTPSRAEAESLPILWTEGQVLTSLAKMMYFWKNLCVPHVYLRSSRREMDLAIVTPNRRLWCMEVKLSLADWKRDLHKPDYPSSVKPSRFYYAIPAHLVGLPQDQPWPRQTPVIPEWVPSHAGILWLSNNRTITTTTDGQCEVQDHPTTLHRLRPAKSLHRQPIADRHYIELLKKLGNAYWNHVAGHDQTPLRIELES